MPMSKTSFLRRLERNILKRLGTGLLVAIPLLVTVVVFRFLYVSVEDMLKEPVTWIFGRHVHGVGFAFFVVVLYLVGLVATTVLGRRFIHLGHGIMGNIPVVQTVYRLTHDALNALAASKRDGFKRVVLVEWPRKGVKSIAFVTGHLTDPEGRPSVAVYLPTTPNPTSGYLAILPEDEVIPTEMGVEDAMKMIVSGGILVAPGLQVEVPQDSEI